MDDKLPADLHAKLLDAIERRSRIEQEIHRYVDNIAHVREALGNPYFFHPRPVDHSESHAKYTGYASHELALQLIRAQQNVQQEITDLLNHLAALEN
jgi:hypothetical protein